MVKSFVVIDSANVSWERLAGEVIAIQLTTGHYYSMGGSAADIWSLLENGADLEGIVRKLAGFFQLPDSARLEIEHFLDNAHAVGLLIEGESESHKEGELPNDYERLGWIPPLLQEYTDLQDLILVDPVHDTKAVGWPELKEE